MPSFELRFRTLALGLVAGAASLAAHAAYDFVDIVYQGQSNQVFGINKSAQVGGVTNSPSGVNQSFVYNANTGTYTLLAPSAGYASTQLSGINDAGVSTGSVYVDPTSDTAPVIGVVRSSNGAYATFQVLSSTQVYGRSISNTGVVGGYYVVDPTDPNSNTAGFIYNPSNGSLVANLLPSPATIAHGNNSSGQVVGSVFLDPDVACTGCPRGRYGWLRSAAGAVTYFRVNALPTSARGISDNGLVAGFVAVGGGVNEGFVTTAASLVGTYQALTIPAAQYLVPPGATTTTPEGVNVNGQVVGIWSASLDGSTPNVGFIATPAVTTALTTNTQAMNGNLKVAQGSTLQVGFDLTMPGSHPPAHVGVGGASVVFNATCATGTPGAATITVPIPNQLYTLAANDSAWYPSSDQNSPATYQGTVSVPAFCSPGALVSLRQGGNFSASVTTAYKVNLRWHYLGGTTGGGWSGTVSANGS